jgi:hypothetical protein
VCERERKESVCVCERERERERERNERASKRKRDRQRKEWRDTNINEERDNAQIKEKRGGVKGISRGRKREIQIER